MSNQIFIVLYLLSLSDCIIADVERFVKCFLKSFSTFLETLEGLPTHPAGAGAVVDHPAPAGAVVGDVVFSTAVNGGNGAEHIRGGETEARPHRAVTGAGDTGERETSHFWHLREKISVPKGGGEHNYNSIPLLVKQ
jgi:hypothetical protein